MSFRFILCAEIGQPNLFTALALLEERLLLLQRGDINELNLQLAQRKKIKAASLYHCRYLERLPLGTSYPNIVNQLYAAMQTPELVGETVLLMDQTGVGRSLMDMARDKGLSPVGITIHGGRELTAAEDGYHIPKRDIVIGLVRLFQSERLLIARALEHAEALSRELLSFRLKISKTGRQLFESWREEDHDDLVLAVGIAAWYASFTGGLSERLLSFVPRYETDWDPLAWEEEKQKPLFNPMQFPDSRFFP